MWRDAWGNCFFCLARRVTYLLIEKLERNVVLEFGQRELCVRYSENAMAKKVQKKDIGCGTSISSLEVLSIPA